MQEGTIMELVKWFVGLLLVMLILAITVFGIELSSVNNFKQQVNYQIERNGGLTDTALKELDEYSHKYYGGRFKVESDKLKQKVVFGEIVDYKIIGTFKVKFFSMPDIALRFNGTGVSQVR